MAGEELEDAEMYEQIQEGIANETLEATLSNLKEQLGKKNIRVIDDVFEFLEDCHCKSFFKENIKSLEVHASHIARITPRIGELTQLTILSIELGSISRLPHAIGNLTQLVHVSFEGNCLTGLPESFANLTELQVVNLSHNMLRGIPEPLKRCRRLKSLDLSNNFLMGDITFPHEWESISNLNLLNCRLLKVPVSISRLTQLESLDLCHNKLVTLPPMGPLRNLISLHIQFNQFRQVPLSVRKLTNLRNLLVSGCEISKLPEWLGELTNLNVLMANANRISELPKGMGQLKNLHFLQIQDNILKEIPKYVAMLPRLITISLDPLKYFPPSISYNKPAMTLNLSRHSDYGNCVTPCSICLDPMEKEMPSVRGSQSLMLLAARRLPKYSNLSLAAVPEPCLELAKSARPCSTPRCSGVFVKGGGREAIEYLPLSDGKNYPFYFTTCHPLCCEGAPRKWSQE